MKDIMLLRNRKCRGINPKERRVYKINEKKYSLDNTLKIFNELEGLDELKDELNMLAKISKFYRMKDPRYELNLPLVYVLAIDDGMGISTILEYMSIILHTSGYIDVPKYREINNKNDFFEIIDRCERFYINENVSMQSSAMLNLIKAKNIKEYGLPVGITAINLNFFYNKDNESEIVMYEANEDNIAEKISKIMTLAHGKCIFVLTHSRSKTDKCRNALTKLDALFQFKYFDIKPYTNNQLINIGLKLLTNKGFKTDEYAAIYLSNRILADCNIHGNINIRNLKRIVNEIKFEKLKQYALNAIDREHFVIDESDIEAYRVIEAKNKYNAGLNGGMDVISYNECLKELDNLVGLVKIKEKVKEIACLLQVQKKIQEKGGSTNGLCFHMAFTGNPGTGKTSVARILGRIFKALGLIEKGDFFEVGRSDLVGKFVGHTAPKVERLIEEAKGSVLFIDEAYSIYGGDNHIDFGYEALATLIKHMEENRNNQVIIFAGYKSEMENLFKMNPGLNDRIPYKIDFPDYSVDELCEIFRRMADKDNNYIIEEVVFDSVRSIMECALKNKCSNFGNGRFVRNIFERLQIISAKRAVGSGAIKSSGYNTISINDIENLFEEYDLLTHSKNTLKIGFGR